MNRLLTPGLRRVASHKRPSCTAMMIGWLIDGAIPIRLEPPQPRKIQDGGKNSTDTHGVAAWQEPCRDEGR